MLWGRVFFFFFKLPKVRYFFTGGWWVGLNKYLGVLALGDRQYTDAADAWYNSVKLSSSELGSRWCNNVRVFYYVGSRVEDNAVTKR